MQAFLAFLAFCAALALAGWIVSKITGSRAWYLESWVFEDGETILWRDDRADVVLVPRLGQAAFMRPLRLRRWRVVATNRRILLAVRTFTGKGMVSYVLWPGQAPDDLNTRVDGGLLTRGYTSLMIGSGQAHPAAKPRWSYVALTPLANQTASLNLLEIRVYTEQAANFPMP